MGLPPGLFFDQSNQAPPQVQGGSLDDALFNSAQAQTQMPPMPSYQGTPDSMASLNQPSPAVQQGIQQPPANNAQNAGPVKAGLRHVLGQMLQNFSYGAGQSMIAASGGETDAQKAFRLARQQQMGAESDLAGAQAQNARSEATARNVQSRLILLIDPQTGGAATNPDGSIRIGTLADQKEMNDMFKVTGGYMSVPDGLAASIGAPELAGKQVPVNTFNSLMNSQSAKTVESEIVRLSQYEVSKGRDPNQSQAIQSLIGIKKALQGYTPQVVDEQYRQLYAAQHGGQELTPDQKNWMAAYEHQKTLVPSFNIKMQNSDGGLGPNSSSPATPAAPTAPGTNPPAPAQKTISQVPSQLQGSVQAVLDYRQPMPPQGRNNARNNAIRDWVNTIDPTYDETTFPARNKILTDYTSGPQSNSINAINTALGHLGELNTANEAMNHNDLPLLHQIAAKMGIAAGDDAATTYQNILHRVSPEVTTAYLANGGAANERGANESDFEQGYQQNKSNIAETAQLLHSKTASLNQQWMNTFRPSRPEDQFDARFLTPAAKATLSQLSAQAPTNRGMVLMRAPNSAETRMVPAEKVAGYQAKGATVVNQ